MSAETKRTRPGGRTERIRRSVAQAVLQLIRERGIDFEIQEVAKLSGVGRATLFRRWPERADLIGEALGEHVSRLKVELTGDWKRDFYSVSRALRHFFRDPTELAMNRVLFLNKNAAFKEQIMVYWRPIIEMIAGPIHAAQQRGEIDKTVDIEMIVQMMMAVLVTEALIEAYPPDEDLAARLVDQLLRGCPTPVDQ